MTDREHIQKLLQTHERQLQLLQEQQATFGLTPPTYILLGIEHEEAEIANLRAQLGQAADSVTAQSNLPRQPYFFGREQELEEIAAALAPESRTWGVLIDGPGGIGKTTLAVRAGHLAPATQFPRKIFLSAKVRELTPSGEQPLEDYLLPNFIALLTELARELGDDAIAKTDPAQRPKIVRDLLARSSPRLARTTPQERNELYGITNGNPLLIRWIAGQLGREGSQCRTIAEASHFMEAAPADNDPLEYIFGDLLDTFTEAETAVLAALTHFTQPAQVEWLTDMTSLPRPITQTALEDLADRALIVANAEEKTFFLPPLAGLFLRNKYPQLVSESGQRLTDQVYALVQENGYQEYDHFPILEANWSTLAAALPLFVQGDNARLQRVCDAIDSFLDFSVRGDEQLTLSQQAEEKAIAVNDFDKAGWRAYQAGYIYSLWGRAKEVLACAIRV